MDKKISTNKNKRMNRNIIDYLYGNEKKLLVFDGATGTSLQQKELNAKDFGGEKYEGCNEHLVLTNPNIVKEVHCDFLKAGADVIETNTFGCNSLVLAEYELEDKSYEINKIAAQLAKEVADQFNSDLKPRFVAGSIGPTTKLPTLGHVTFDELTSSYVEQVDGLVDGGVDLILIETCQDVLQIKSCLKAVRDSFRTKSVEIPIMVSVTMETTGTMLIGTEISAVVSILEPYDIDILGLNCATGPEQMKDHIKHLSEHSPFIVSCIPNAGLPENIGGKAHYRLKPIELKMQLMHFIEDLGVQIIGGCCGTTPEHIELLNELAQEIKPRERNNTRSRLLKDNKRFNNQPSASSIYSITPYKQENSFLIVGERLNASGSKKARTLLNEEDWDGLVGLAREQLRENAHILDINVDYVGRDGVKDMNSLVSRVVTDVNLPLMLDSTDWQKMESGLKVAGGKCILNSTNYEDGEERFLKVLNLAKEYGSALVIGTIDEDGMARTAEHKLAIAKRGFDMAVENNYPAYELFYDPLALPISTGIEEDRANGLETIKAIKMIRDQLIDVHIILGISNVSFGLNPSARITLNSIFLNECIQAGLDTAILSPSKILPLSKIKDDHKKICLDLIYDRRRFDNGTCVYDPLTELTTQFENISTKQARNSIQDLSKLVIEDRLKKHILDGERIFLEETLKEALMKYSALEIINTYLLDGMKTVGELFGAGQMQLPFVLQSAQTMKMAVAYLEPYMEKIDGKSNYKGKFLIATVKGDVHDIGKNLVDIILSNNGYQVINLGIKQDVNAIIEAQKQHKADCIAMSGLLVKSTAFMKDNLEEFNKQGITTPVILGGAALTPKFITDDCSKVYNGKVIYGKDAFSDLRFMDAYVNALKLKKWKDDIGFLDEEPQGLIIGDKSIDSNSNGINSNKVFVKDSLKISNLSNERSIAVKEEPTCTVPFIGNMVLDQNDIDIEEVFNYLDKNALFASQWQFKKRKGESKDQYQLNTLNKANNILKELIEKVITNNLLQPSVAYGYYHCARVGNSLNVFSDDKSSIIGKFEFPRQRSGNMYCISDFFNDIKNDQPTDVLPMQAVTMGSRASEYAQLLFEENEYSEYLYFHGLAVQMSEALAEWAHARIRKEMGFKDQEPTELRDILAQKYRGCRYSFGYPACPNISDSRIQINLLQAGRIGLSIDDSDQLHPEQSTTAIIAVHSKARYFSA